MKVIHFLVYILFIFQKLFKVYTTVNICKTNENIVFFKKCNLRFYFLVIFP